MENADYYVSLREYIDYRFESVMRATDIAYATMEKRLDGMNEFRDTLRDQAGRFITRDELSATVKQVDSDLRALREFKASLEGKASQQSVVIGYVLSVIGVLLGIVGIIIKFVQ